MNGDLDVFEINCIPFFSVLSTIIELGEEESVTGV
jgi:hypothetical protein